MGFRRTVRGQLARHKFHDDPILWVEGEDDASAYDWVRKLGVRLQVAGGKARCEEIARSIRNAELPHAVVMDRDYDLAVRRRAQHRRIVKLDRYAIENYFIDSAIVCSVLNRLAPLGGADTCPEAWREVLQGAMNSLAEMMELDIASSKSKAGLRVIPRPAARLFKGSSDPGPDKGEVKRICDSVKGKIADEYRSAAGELIEEWGGAPEYLLCSDVTFSLVRRFILLECRKRGRKRNVDNRSLFALLSTVMWEVQPHPDHLRLKNRIRRAAQDLLSVDSS